MRTCIGTTSAGSNAVSRNRGSLSPTEIKTNYSLSCYPKIVCVLDYLTLASKLPVDFDCLETVTPGTWKATTEGAKQQLGRIFLLISIWQDIA